MFHAVAAALEQLAVAQKDSLSRVPRGRESDLPTVQMDKYSPVVGKEYETLHELFEAMILQCASFNPSKRMTYFCSLLFSNESARRWLSVIPDAVKQGGDWDAFRTALELVACGRSQQPMLTEWWKVAQLDGMTVATYSHNFQTALRMLQVCWPDHYLREKEISDQYLQRTVSYLKSYARSRSWEGVYAGQLKETCVAANDVEQQMVGDIGAR